MTRAVVLAAVLGAACGVVGGVAGGLLVARDPGRGLGAAGTVRGDLDRLEADALVARTSYAEAVAALLARVADLESRAVPGAAVPADVGVLSRALADDVRSLRDGVARDLRAADARLADLERRVDELAGLVAMAPPVTARGGAATEEDEAVWVNLARDADPLRRFSALAMLGRARTDRSVRASLEALRDPAEIVVWQAARNLGAFVETSAAHDLAALLRSDAVSVRHAAHEALRRLGAPPTDFDAARSPEERRAATESLESWAAEER